ncbi:type II secretion system protein [Clostridium felsineum]|uniref:Uncharacterized protein n=1 Tax=Clostridium felsineum TaxID=36839 RepID=A0A1S8L4C5_9CLOT|nr:type II secretion system protein [Clostridium felsineum]MCR3760239.1 type II secretion system GspH family protein [Clostridium felsineum]URZ00546.1 hypothetical protein CLAUR_005340 [Clostridium felsineum]URZ06836.1 hypothetical protein CLROS_021690 [Clostridium felsineum]URZ11868.1 hypothetical protein CROST_025850 [Clostridium felsineum]URZ16393.1 hypothetical protein CLFE_024400 [Clostridium felsineum DSM 794]
MENNLDTILNKNKKGYTLIEIICAAAIVLILSSVVVMSIKSYKDIRNEIEIKYVNNEMINFINNSRNYCIDKNVVGKLYFDRELNCVMFYKDSQTTIDRFVLPEDFKLQPLITSDGSITIDNKGSINACSILYKDNREKTHIITVCVGTGNVQIKE